MNSKIKQRPRLVVSSLLAAVFIPIIATAAEVPRATFDVANFKEAMAQVTGAAAIAESKQVSIQASSITEEASQTHIKVVTSLPGVEQIAIFAEDNPRPLLANFRLPKDTVSEVGARVKIQKNTNIVAVVKADGKFYTTKYLVKVGGRGCGG